MAEYDIIGGIVSTEALDGLKLFKKEVSEIVTLMKGANLTSLASAKEIAQVDKLRASTEILIEKQKKAAADAAAAALRRDQIIERQIALEEKKAQKEKASADTWLNHQKKKYEEGFKQLQLEEKQFEAMLKAEQKQNEIAAKEASRLAQKEARESAALSKQEQREAIAAAKAEERRVIREAKEIATAQRIANAQAGKIQAAADKEAAKMLQVKTGYINELEKEVKDLILAYKSLSQAELQSVGGKQAMTQLKAKRDELSKLKEEYGDHTMRVGEYSRATNGLRLSMGMLAGELPNAAISARTFIMSLSNNMQGLFQAISAVNAENKIMNQQFKEGLIATKPDSLIKQLTKSLFSLQMGLMVGVALFVAFGEQMIDWVAKALEAKNAALDLAKSINLVNKEVGDLIKGKKQAVQEFIHDYAVAFKNSDKEMLRTLEERGKKEFDLNKETLALIVSDKKNATTEIFKDYLEKAEDAYYDEVIIKKKIDAQVTAETALTSAQNLFRAASNTKSVKGKVSTGVFGEKDFSWDDLVARANDGSLYEATFEGLAIYGVAQNVIDELRTVNAQNKIIKNLPKLRNSSYISKVDDDKGNKGRKGSKSFTEINVTREYYNSEEEMMRRLADLQNDITRENEEGELNSYDKRLKAAELYYKTVTTMAMGEQNVAIANEKEKAAAELSAAKTKYGNNQAKFKKGTPEWAKNEMQFALAEKTIEANKNDAILKINDDYTKKVIAAEKKKSKEILDIEADIFTEKVYYIEQEAALRERLQAALANQQSIGSMALGALGINDNKAFRNASNQRADKMTTIKDKLKGAKGSDRDKLEKELQVAQNEDAQANELEAIRVAEDAKASIVSDSIDTLKALWDSYYAYLEEQIDSQLKKDTKVNDERLAQYEDETKAGLHTADELNKFKERSTAYQTSLDEEAARKKAELDKQQFLLQQAFALGQIWINFAIASTAPSNVGGILTPLLLAQAIASTALVAAQTIPAFAEGGIMDKTGKALLGDGGKRELAISPSGNFFISKDTPTMYNLEKGTQILPDVNKVDLMSILALKQVMPNLKGDNRTEALLQSIDKSIKGQKQGNFYGLPLIRQMNMSDRYSARKRSLMN